MYIFVKGIHLRTGAWLTFEMVGGCIKYKGYFGFS